MLGMHNVDTGMVAKLNGMVKKGSHGHSRLEEKAVLLDTESWASPEGAGPLWVHVPEDRALQEGMCPLPEGGTGRSTAFQFPQSLLLPLLDHADGF